jgi:hypothetical protein
MYIHFVDTSNNRGQYDLSIDCGVRSFLLSYHYCKLERDWANFWEKQKCRLLIDSGAFSAFNSGKAIDPKDYVEWALGFKKRWTGKMSYLGFMNLDVIGDQDASWKNQFTIEKLGLETIPIVTYNAELKHLNRAIDNYNYFALGGLVPYAKKKKLLRAWLDRCFNAIFAKYRETGIMPKVHLLGITSDWVLKRYPSYSSDSSSWMACVRFGNGSTAGISRLPRISASNAALMTNLHVMRSEIKKYQTMEREATNLWVKRGIVFD